MHITDKYINKDKPPQKNPQKDHVWPLKIQRFATFPSVSPENHFAGGRTTSALAENVRCSKILCEKPCLGPPQQCNGGGRWARTAIPASECASWQGFLTQRWCHAHAAAFGFGPRYHPSLNLDPHLKPDTMMKMTTMARWSCCWIYGMSVWDPNFTQPTNNIPLNSSEKQLFSFSNKKNVIIVSKQ